MAPVLALVACAALVAGCSTHTQVVDTSTQSFKPIDYSPDDTCDTQRQIAEHNSVYDTLKTGKTVSYAPPCDRHKPMSIVPPQPKVAAR